MTRPDHHPTDALFIVAACIAIVAAGVRLHLRRDSMGYEVSRRRVYGPTDNYCNGSGISVLVNSLDEAERTFEDFNRAPHPYPCAVFITSGGGEVVKSSGPALAEVDRAMNAAWRRRHGKAA